MFGPPIFGSYTSHIPYTMYSMSYTLDHIGAILYTMYHIFCTRHYTIWMVVKILVPFGLLSIIRHLVFRGHLILTTTHVLYLYLCLHLHLYIYTPALQSCHARVKNMDSQKVILTITHKMYSDAILYTIYHILYHIPYSIPYTIYHVFYTICYNTILGPPDFWVPRCRQLGAAQEAKAKASSLGQGASEPEDARFLKPYQAGKLLSSYIHI